MEVVNPSDLSKDVGAMINPVAEMWPAGRKEMKMSCSYLGIVALLALSVLVGTTDVDSGYGDEIELFGVPVSNHAEITALPVSDPGWCADASAEDHQQECAGLEAEDDDCLCIPIVQDLDRNLLPQLPRKTTLPIPSPRNTFHPPLAA
jgi:hypothetical protein